MWKESERSVQFAGSYEEPHKSVLHLWKNFVNKHLLRRHIRCVHEELKSVVCHLCAKTFRDNYGLNRHLNELHKEGIEENLRSSSKTKKSGMNKENEPPGKSKLVMKKACPLCNLQVRKLNWHLKTKHDVDKNLEPVFKTFKYHCKTCDKPMRDLWNLSRHEKSCVAADPQTDYRCDVCLKIFVSKQNLTAHKKAIHETSKICEKCKKSFENKQSYFDHLPCFYSCGCGKLFSSFFKFTHHGIKCERGKPTSRGEEVSKTQYHNVISYQCFVCSLNDIKAENVRAHVADNHVIEGPLGCKSCQSEVKDIADHIFNKHSSVRRLKLSYVKAPTLLPLAVAVKSKPIYDKAVTVTVDENEQPEQPEQQESTDPGEGSVVNIEDEQEKDLSAVSSVMDEEGFDMEAEPLSRILEPDPESVGDKYHLIPDPHPYVEEVSSPMLPQACHQGPGLETLQDEDPTAGMVPDVKDCGVSLDILLAVEPEELRQKNHELDVLDKKIEEDFNSARMNDEILEKSIQDLKNSIRNQERAADQNQERAEALSRIDLEVIRNLAFSSSEHNDSKVQGRNFTLVLLEIFSHCSNSGSGNPPPPPPPMATGGIGGNG